MKSDENIFIFLFRMGTVLNFHKLKLRFEILPISLTTYNQEPKELSIYIEHEVCRTQSFILADD